jgi:hypothetical protein
MPEALIDLAVSLMAGVTGTRRWTILYHNPNKTAVLLVLICLALWGGVYLGKRWRYFALAVSSVGAVLLALTRSRGGVIAALLSFAALFAFLPLTRREKSASAGLLLAVLMGSGLWVGFDKRFAAFMTGEDVSVLNRVTIWSSVPAMMTDAPLGWGRGCSGEVFMRWYQQPGRTESYRTLVSSHLTTLVEGGFLRGGLYVWLLGFCLLVAWPGTGRTWYATSFSLWLCLIAGGLFSSVLEARLLWVLPMVGTCGVVVSRLRARLSLPWQSIARLSAFIAALLAIVGAWGWLSTRTRPYVVSKGQSYGETGRMTLHVVGPQIDKLGLEFFHALRADSLNDRPAFAWRVWNKEAEVPPDARGIMLITLPQFAFTEGLASILSRPDWMGSGWSNISWFVFVDPPWKPTRLVRWIQPAQRVAVLHRKPTSMDDREWWATGFEETGYGAIMTETTNSADILVRLRELIGIE